MTAPFLLQQIVNSWMKIPASLQKTVLAPFKYETGRLLAGTGNGASITSLLTMIYLIEAAESCKVIQASKDLTVQARLVFSILRTKERYIPSEQEAQVIVALYHAVEYLIQNVSNRDFSKIEKRYKGLIASDKVKKLPHPEQKNYNHTLSLVQHERRK